jgi:hypothetical protein
MASNATIEVEPIYCRTVDLVGYGKLHIRMELSQHDLSVSLQRRLMNELIDAAIGAIDGLDTSVNPPLSR